MATKTAEQLVAIDYLNQGYSAFRKLLIHGKFFLITMLILYNSDWLNSFYFLFYFTILFQVCRALT
jgi:hypothetical protein